MKNESDVKKEIKKILKAAGSRLHYRMPAASQYGQSGTHDFLIWQNGVGWTIEAKYGGNTPTPLQKKFARELRGANCFSLLVDETNINNVRSVVTCIAYDGSFPRHLAWNPDDT